MRIFKGSIHKSETQKTHERKTKRIILRGKLKEALKHPAFFMLMFVLFLYLLFYSVGCYFGRYSEETKAIMSDSNWTETHELVGVSMSDSNDNPFGINYETAEILEIKRGFYKVSYEHPNRPEDKPRIIVLSERGLLLQYKAVPK